MLLWGRLWGAIKSNSSYSTTIKGLYLKWVENVLRINERYNLE